jgi:undecaprenyl-diphosphatase
LLVFSLNRKWPFLRRRDDGRLALDYWGLLWLVFALSFAYRISRIAGGDHQLFAEEAQYWEWSRRLALSYYSKPPLIAFIIRLGTALFGHTEFGVRVGALAATTALTVLTGFFAWSLGRSARVVFFAVLFLSLSPLFAVASVVHTTDTPVGLFWGLTLYLVYLAVFHDKKRMWYAAGFAFGLGLLSKYAMVYLIPCAGLFLLMSKPDRRWLKRREPWLALLIGLLVFSPVIWWNWRNGFASFLHVSEQVATKSGFQLRPDKFFEFVGSQFGVVSPVLFGAMLWVAWAVLSRRALRENRPYLFLLCVSLPIFLMILFKSMLGKVQANWAALSYYAWLLLVVHYFSDLYERTRGTKTARRIVGWTFAALLTAGLITTLIHESSFIRSKSVASLLERVGVKSPHKLDPEWRALGWKELGKRLNSMIARAPSPERVFLVSTRYQDAALTAFYTKGNPPSYNVNYGRRMNQYDIWPGPAERAGWDAILITLMDNKAVRDHGRMSQSFERSDPPELVELRIKGRVYHTYMVSMHYGFLGKFAFERVPESH